MAYLKIIALSVLAAATYGVLHDQVTARVCVEYFTIGHARLIDSDSPTVLGLFWGVVATWWVGLPLGVVLSLAARAGSRPKLDARDLVVPIAKLMLVMYACALIAGVTGYYMARAGKLHYPPAIITHFPPAVETRFLADACAHLSSYTVGLIGGLVLAVLTFRRRAQKSFASSGASALR